MPSACVMIAAATVLPACRAAAAAGEGRGPRGVPPLAIAADPGLRSDELESAAADARLREMQGQNVPSVSLQAGYSRLSDVAPGSLTIPGPAAR